MSKYNVSMFEKIKTILETQSSSSSGFKDILKFDINNNYVVRLLPNIKNPDDTFFHYFSFGWESVATGQYMSALSPITFGERCPINELRIKLYRSKNQNDNDLAKLIKRQEQWMVNAYVIDNPTDRNTEGEIKIIRYGKQLDKVITEAISGDDADEIGPAVFDLSENGCNLRIKVEKNEGGYKTYVSSKFLKASAVPGVDDSKSDDIYNNVIDLTTIQPTKSWDELQEMIDVHLLNRSNSGVVVPDTSRIESTPSVSESMPSPSKKEETLKEELPMEFDKSADKKKTDEFSDADLDDLIADL